MAKEFGLRGKPRSLGLAFEAPSIPLEENFLEENFGFGPSRGRGLLPHITHPRGGRSVRGSPVKGNGTETRGHRNRYSPQVID
jgi:hypothetical protein